MALNTRRSCTKRFHKSKVFRKENICLHLTAKILLLNDHRIDQIGARNMLISTAKATASPNPPLAAADRHFTVFEK